jgi:hypothetical protein
VTSERRNFKLGPPADNTEKITSIELSIDRDQRSLFRGIGERIGIRLCATSARANRSVPVRPNQWSRSVATRPWLCRPRAGSLNFDNEGHVDMVDSLIVGHEK